MLKLIATAAISLALLGCSGPQSGVEVKDAWSPLAPPGATVLAVYATIVAHDSDTLVSVSTPAARETQLHATSEENGMMKMRPVERVELKAGETVRLEPGAMHLMLMDPDPARATKSPISLTFRFAKAGEIQVTAQVKEAE
jgi:hypothetical protein